MRDIGGQSRRSQSSSGAHSSSRPRGAGDHADVARPGGGSGRARDQRAARARALSGGTMRSAAGTATKAGRSSAAGSTGRPATRQVAGRGVLAPYQPPRHSRATGAASGTPSFSQSSSATKRSARGWPGRGRRRRGYLAGDGAGLDGGEQGLQRVDGQGAARASRGSSEGSRAARRSGVVRGVRVEVPGGREQGEAAHGVVGAAAGPGRRRGRAGRPCSSRPASRARPPRRGARLSRATRSDRVKRALGRAGPAPVEQRGGARPGGEPAQDGAAGHEVQDVGAVDQAGHEQHGGVLRVAVVEQAGGAFRPEHGRVGQRCGRCQGWRR